MFEQIKAISSSPLQSEIAFLLLDGPKGVGELAKKIGKATAAINHALIPMQEEGIVEKCSRDYHLTNAGRIHLAILSQAERSINALEEFREFWLKHDLGDIPPNLLARIGGLEGSRLVKSKPDDMSNVLETFLEVLRRSKSIHGISPIIMPGYVEATTEMVGLGIEVSYILTDQILKVLMRDYPTELDSWLQKPNFRLYRIPDVKIAFTVTDSIISLGMFRIDGEYDSLTDLCGQGEEVTKWGEDLFTHCLSKSELID